MQQKLYLGNLDAQRDWGYAEEYVESMWLMLQRDEPDDFVIATNQTHTIRDFLEVVFQYLDLNWQDHVVQDPKFFRPAEVDLLVGDATKARDKLGWKPGVSLDQLVATMVDSDMELVRNQR